MVVRLDFICVEHEEKFDYACCLHYEYEANVYEMGDLTTFERGFCPRCGVIDCKVVKSPPMPPPVLGWGKVGHYFDRCIIL